MITDINHTNFIETLTICVHYVYLLNNFLFIYVAIKPVNLVNQRY